MLDIARMERTWIRLRLRIASAGSWRGRSCAAGLREGGFPSAMTKLVIE